MNNNIILVAETGSDIPPSLAERYGIYLVPMHVTMGEHTLDDTTFPPEEICRYYARTGKLPKTSGCSPEDFTKVFDEIHCQHKRKYCIWPILQLQLYPTKVPCLRRRSWIM